MPKKSSSKKLKQVKHAEIWKDMTVVELLEEYKKVGFNGKEHHGKKYYCTLSTNVP